MSLLGLDLGTTAVKAGLFDEEGRVIGFGAASYDLLMPAPGIVELPGEEYIRAVSEAISTAAVSDPTNVSAIGICTQGETFVPVDSSGCELRNFIVWLDTRAIEEADELSSRFDATEFYHCTGLPGINPAFNLPKLLWLCRNEPELLERTHKILHLEDYIIRFLTGEASANDSASSTTGYVDIRSRDWWHEGLAIIGFDASRLAPLTSSGTVVGRVRAEAARRIGIKAGIPVVSGPIDQAAGAVGAGNTGPGVLTETTGGALATVTSTLQPVFDPERRVLVGIHGAPNKYTILTYSPTGGLVLKWVRDLFGHEIEYEALCSMAASVARGSEGITFVPHLAGMVIPHLDSEARGALFGLSIAHGRPHLARAALESVAFMLLEHVEMIEAIGVATQTVRSLGGGAKSELWLQIKADVLGRVVETPACGEAASLGAALIAGASTGIWNTLEEAISSGVRISHRFEPTAEGMREYDEYYARYQRLSADFYTRKMT